MTDAQIRYALFVAWDILNGDAEPSNENIDIISDAADSLGYELGWRYAEDD